MIFSVFEDLSYHSLYPLNQLRASFELRCGAFTNLERINNTLKPGDEIQLLVRNELQEVTKERYPEYNVNPPSLSPGIWLNGSCLWSEEIIQQISSGRSYTEGETILAIHCQKDVNKEKMFDYIKNVSSVSTEIKIPIIKNIWDAIFLQGDIIISDAQYFLNYKSGKIHSSVVMENSDNIFIGENSDIRPGVVLDASSGPIIIGDHVHIDIGSLIQGPVYIGHQSRINPGAKLRGNITLGPMCRIGGEIEDVIFQGYGNKQHDGFLGHSYLGEWVNLGANTNNSDLKNNYGNIRLQIGEREIETGKQFLGTIMGDFVRTGISTMLNTGTVIGLGANIYGEGFQKKYIPPFQWGRSDRTDLNKFIKTVEIMKQRRKKTLTEPEKELFSMIYEELS